MFDYYENRYLLFKPVGQRVNVVCRPNGQTDTVCYCADGEAPMQSCTY